MRRPLLLLGLALGLSPSVTAAADDEALKLGEAAPPFVLKTMNGQKSGVPIFALKDFIGAGAKKPQKSVVLSFAASYCEPCKRELGELKTMKTELDAAGVMLAVVVIDTEPDGIELMRKLTVDTLALGYPVLSDRFGVLARRYHATALPMTVVIAEDGTVKWINSGFAEGALDKLRTTLGLPLVAKKG